MIIIYKWMLFLYGIFGFILFLIAFYDIIWTTLSASETGPISFAIMICYKYIGMVFKSFRLVHRILRFLGLLTFITTIFIWYILLWLAWSFIFWSAEGNVVSSATGIAADKIEKIYFTGWLIFTAGLGDYKPVGYFFQLITAFANCVGLVMVAITVSYLVSATDAVTRQRQLAGQISALGTSPDEIICNAWDGKNIEKLDSYMSSLADDISQSAQQLIRFPLIFNFHSIELIYSPVVKIAVLDEIVTISECCIHPDNDLSSLCKIQVRNSIDQYIFALQRIGIHNGKTTDPPLPPIQKLKDKGIPLLPEHKWLNNLCNSEILERRKLLKMLIYESGRSFKDVYPTSL